MKTAKWIILGVVIVALIFAGVYQNSRIERLEDRVRLMAEHEIVTKAEAKGFVTKEFFVPVTFGSQGIVSSTARPVVTIDAESEYALISFWVPADFTSIIAAELIGVARAGDGTNTMTLEFLGSYAAIGEGYGEHEEYSLTQASEANASMMELLKWDISTVLTSLAAGDHVGIKAIYSQGALASAVNVIGVRFKYS